MIAVNVLVQSFGKPAPDFPYRGDHHIETTNFFFHENSGARYQIIRRCGVQARKAHPRYRCLTRPSCYNMGRLALLGSESLLGFSASSAH